ncbi:MAG TPA: chemotaxis protein CheW [Gemmatimonadaceae bacterium]|nr:chemotaxis protein CheW [Gemmatimonadaceae bacterium]
MTTPKKTTKAPVAPPSDEQPAAAAAAKPKRQSRKRTPAAAAAAAVEATTPAAAELHASARTVDELPPTPVELAAMLNAALHVPVAERAAPAIEPAVAPSPAVVEKTVAAPAPLVGVTPPEPVGIEGEFAIEAAEAAAAAAAALLPLADRVRTREGTADLLVFRVGGELFGAALTAIEEALELPQLSPLPEMPPSMIGVVSLRGRMLPAYSPARPLGVALARADAAALVLRAGERRIALAVDDVDDVLTVDLSELRPPPIVVGEERDAVLLGVANRGADLVSVLDADALVTACLLDQALEIA